MSGSSESTLALFEQFRTLGDNDLIRLAQKGNQEAVSFLLNKYKSLVKMKATSYFLVGADKEDLIQEGMIGLYKAILDFRENKEASFRVFAEFCIIRQMITAIKTATGRPHRLESLPSPSISPEYPLILPIAQLHHNLPQIPRSPC
ncbi:RNA polymerase sporulation-specific sigma factor [Candidatus Hakubella thermalkaliphila]|uniref:RNA polymerase sporulation-specific sigma factor n=1 Tax=Candidatus Hakubella thermalkaliphila TaxID=2754717 RepID=A0A6V8Q1A7_9ACTN|nr:sigma factor [Candidatus Hakubella thermalkaliphila]GFP37874.1 RNA polymerase sporulation-specific sigma factor [Candidatus Hakubella thermalkaliphila]